MSGFSLSFKIAKDDPLTPPPTHFMWVAPDLIRLSTIYKEHGALNIFKERLHTTLTLIHSQQPMPHAILVHMPDVDLVHLNGSYITPGAFASLLAIEELTGCNVQLLKSMKALSWLSEHVDLPHPTLFVWTGAAPPKLHAGFEWGVYVDVDANSYEPLESTNVSIDTGGLMFEEKVTAALYLTKKIHQIAMGRASIASSSMIYPEVILVIGKMDGKTWRPYKKTLIDLIASNKLGGIMVADCMYGRVESVVVPPKEDCDEEEDDENEDGDEDGEEDGEKNGDDEAPPPPPIRIFSDSMNVQDVERMWFLLKRHPAAYNSYVFVGDWSYTSSEAQSAFVRLEKENTSAQSSIVYEPMAWWTLHGGLNGLVEHNKPDVVVDQIRFSVCPNAMLECFAEFTDEET